MSTTQVDFYLLEAASDDEAERFLCRLCEKAFRLAQRVLVVAEEPQLSRLDELLWSFRPESFIPHEKASDARDQAIIPVLLSASSEQASGRDVLVNLANSVPASAAQESRIVELVWGDPQARAHRRARYREYRALGLNPGTIQIDARF
ncbi:MAG: DNA polymerase III subunit chi [Hahellaceae bacterium]|nr:DNA polymerase III subunit chi [Hahellaceae bacterium]